ncbi:lipopolysaccharide biosynthesis protein [Pseudomonas sp. DWP3-1-2]|uniref:lipopolysaccharide biosynthesis protein n=1 Tax=Pseudomonas sp. DWP3-1-2 TaxID=2804645 RepID=UPI003CEA3B6A
MFISLAVVYTLRVISGLGTLLAILLIDRAYGSEEIAHYAVFMFLFNLGTVVAVWGSNVIAVDTESHRVEASSDIRMGHKLLDGLIAATVFYLLLNASGYWRAGLSAVIPLGIAGLIAAMLIVRKRPAAAILCNEFGRAFVPLLVMFLILYRQNVPFGMLVDVSYLTLFVLLPVLILYVHRQPCWRIDYRLRLSVWLIEKKQAVPIVLPQLLIVIVAQSDRLVIERWGDARELASYFAAQALYTVVLFGSHAVLNSVMPDIAKVATQNAGSLRREGQLMLKVTGVLSALLIPAAYVYFGLIDIDRPVAMCVLMILVVGGLVSSMLGIGVSAMQFCQNKRMYMYLVASGLICQYLTILALFEYFGVYAVALGFFTYSAVTSLVAAVYWQRKKVLVNPLCS